MAKKACKQCSTLIEKEDKCPKCGGTDFSETWKGRVIILNPEQSEVAQNLKIKEKGTYAIKTR